MGKPIRDQWLNEIRATHAEVTGLPAGNELITGLCKIGANAVAKYTIVQQKGANKFRVQDSAGNEGTCTLVNKPGDLSAGTAALADNEMMMNCIDSGDIKHRVMKVMNRTLIYETDANVSKRAMWGWAAAAAAAGTDTGSIETVQLQEIETVFATGPASGETIVWTNVPPTPSTYGPYHAPHWYPTGGPGFTAAEQFGTGAHPEYPSPWAQVVDEGTSSWIKYWSYSGSNWFQMDQASAYQGDNNIFAEYVGISALQAINPSVPSTHIPFIMKIMPDTGYFSELNDYTNYSTLVGIECNCIMNTWTDGYWMNVGSWASPSFKFSHNYAIDNQSQLDWHAEVFVDFYESSQYNYVPWGWQLVMP